MKLTPEEYLKVLHRRNELELTPEEVKYVKEERLKEHTEWSTYLHYLKKISLKKNDVPLSSPSYSSSVFKDNTPAYLTSSVCGNKL